MDALSGLFQKWGIHPYEQRLVIHSCASNTTNFNQAIHLLSLCYAAIDEVKLAQASHSDQPHMHAFNKWLSSDHITSEHAFGLLKANFPSLKEMGKHEDI